MKWFSLLFCLLIARVAASQNRVELVVGNFENNKGVCRACIFSSEKNFRESRPLRCERVAVEQKTARLVFDSLPNGSYAIFVFHDANINGKLDVNFLGIPKEGYGASRNKLPFAASPKFEPNKFLLSGTPVQLSITLRNL